MRPSRHYARAVRRAFASVPFYREQWAAAGTVLAEPVPTPVGALPDPPYSLCPFARPWSASREPSLWTPGGRPLARVLRLAGCDTRRPVLEIRDALLDPGRRGRRYGVLLAPSALVARPARRDELNGEALAALRGGPAWLVGTAAEIAEVRAGPGLHPVVRVSLGVPLPPDGPVVLHDQRLGYLGARRPDCGELHLDTPRVYAHVHGGHVAFSLPGQRRPTLLDILPPGSDRVALDCCPRHGTDVVRWDDPVTG